MYAPLDIAISVAETCLPIDPMTESTNDTQPRRHDDPFNAALRSLLAKRRKNKMKLADVNKVVVLGVRLKQLRHELEVIEKSSDLRILLDDTRLADQLRDYDHPSLIGQAFRDIKGILSAMVKIQIQSEEQALKSLGVEE